MFRMQCLDEMRVLSLKLLIKWLNLLHFDLISSSWCFSRNLDFYIKVLKISIYKRLPRINVIFHEWNWICISIPHWNIAYNLICSFFLNEGQNKHFLVLLGSIWKMSVHIQGKNSVFRYDIKLVLIFKWLDLTFSQEIIELIKFY